MAKPAPSRDGVSVVIPVYNAGEPLKQILAAWGDALARLGRGYEIIVVDDGSTDATAEVLQRLTSGTVRHLRWLKHTSRRGFGACLRTALAEVEYPLFFYTSIDYPYTPGDLRQLLERIEVRDELLGKQPDLIGGCRTGQLPPIEVRWLSRAWRLFARIAFGMQMQPTPAWQGMKGYFFGTFVGWVFGVPLADVNSAFKLYRTSFLKRFPIQSEGTFVHAELAAKATFLTSIVDELPLSPNSSRRMETPPVWREMWRIFKRPEFGVPPSQSSDDPQGMSSSVPFPSNGPLAPSEAASAPPPASPLAFHSV